MLRSRISGRSEISRSYGRKLIGHELRIIGARLEVATLHFLVGHAYGPRDWIPPPGYAQPGLTRLRLDGSLQAERS
jgi:hypothetical protein